MTSIETSRPVGDKFTILSQKCVGKWLNKAGSEKEGITFTYGKRIKEDSNSFKLRGWRGEGGATVAEILTVGHFVTQGLRS